VIGHLTFLACLFVASPPVETAPILSPAEFRVSFDSALAGRLVVPAEVKRAARSFRVRAGTRGDSYEHHRMDRSRPSPRLGHRRLPVRLGGPVNTAVGPQDVRPPTAGRRVVSTGVAVTLIAVGAILRFALAGGSPHGLNVHVVGVS